MEKKQVFKIYFVVVGIYDVLLGGAFALFYKSIFGALSIALPNHPGYIYVPALFLISGGIGEFLIARNMLKNVDLVIMRLLMKLSFAIAVFYAYFTGGIPNIFLIIASLSIIGVVKNLMFIRWAKLQNSSA